MENENLFDGQHYITAQVFIKADDFAKEMLGENLTPRKLEDFIKENASLMDIVYGSAYIMPRVGYVPSIPDALAEINGMVNKIASDTDYLIRKASEAEIDQILKKTPWYKRLFCK